MSRIPRWGAELVVNWFDRRVAGTALETRMRCLAVGAILVVCFTNSASADSDPVANFYGNTMVGLSPQGSYVRVYFFADRTWAAIDQRGPAQGTTVLTGTEGNYKVCNTREFPSAPGNPANAVAPAQTVCYPIQPRQVGDKWTEVDPDGTVTFTLLPGHQ